MVVDTVNQPAAVTSGTYTFTNVQAVHSISATFTGGTATITATAGTGGSVTPPGVTTVPIGSNVTYTITPNAGYSRATVLVDGVSNPTAVSTGTYTFTSVTTGNHTISATFQSNLATITVTAPTGTTSQPQNSALPVTWTTNSAVASGQFSIWVVSPANGWYVGKIVPANGTNNYPNESVNLDVPAGTGYRIFVYYRTSSADPWSIYGIASGTVDVTAVLNTISVTAPTGTQTLAQGSGLSVSWTTNVPVSAPGEFSMWVVSQSNGWYMGTIVPADGTNSYPNKTVNLNVPAGTGYRIFVYYRASSADPWGVYGMAPGTVDVTAGFTTISVTSPTGVVSQAQGSALQVSWTTNAPVSAPGEFSMWVVSQSNGWYMGTIVPADGTNSYPNKSVNLNVPIGVGYRIYVYYRAISTDPWGIYGLAPGTVTVF